MKETLLLMTILCRRKSIEDVGRFTIDVRHVLLWSLLNTSYFSVAMLEGKTLYTDVLNALKYF